MDDLEYLQPSFDPASLTMPRLRNILMTHDIKYPPSAKKPQLVDIFLQELKPQGRKLLAARDRVRRTSEGIINQPSRYETPAQEDDDRHSMPPPSVAATPRPRTSRKSVRASTEESTVGTTPSTKKKASSKRSASKSTRQSDTETDADNQVVVPPRKTPKSHVPSSVKLEEPERLPVRPSLPESAFSDENPFQSGSSPLSEDNNRRKSTGTNKDKKRSSSGRRKTDGVLVPSTRSFEMPVSSLDHINDGESEEVEAGEDFTPEAQNELDIQRAAEGSKQLIPHRARRKPTKSKVPGSAPWVVLSALLLGWATWYRQEKLAVGYCGIGRPSNALSAVQIPEWASFLQPTCEPCPQHAICYEELDARCEQGFLLQNHPLSLGGLVPLPPTCEPDGEKARKVKAVADRAIETLRQRKADAECGTLKDEQGHSLPAEIPEKDLKKEVRKNKRRGMDDAEFEELWKGAIGEIVGREEVVTSQDGYVR